MHKEGGLDEKAVIFCHSELPLIDLITYCFLLEDFFTDGSTFFSKLENE